MINPVLKKELKTKSRTWKTSALITVYLLMLTVLLVLYFLGTNIGYRGMRGFRFQRIKEFYIMFTVLQFGLIMFIVPAMTASSISGEKQRKTFDLLVCTRMSSLSIVLGKLTAALAQIFILLLVSVPILSVLFLFGGMSVKNVIILFAFYMITAVFLGSIGMFASAYFKKIMTSTVVSYLITLFLTIGTIISIIIIQEVFNIRDVAILASKLHLILYTNPITGFSGILSEQLGTSFFVASLYRQNPTFSTINIVYINLAFDIIASVILIYLTSLKINPMKKMKPFFRKKNRKVKS